MNLLMLPSSGYSTPDHSNLSCPSLSFFDLNAISAIFRMAQPMPGKAVKLEEAVLPRFASAVP